MSSYDPPPTPPGPPSGPPGGYGYGPPAPVWNVGDALTYGWRKFQDNLAPILLATVAMFGAILVLVVLWVVVQASVLGGSSEVTIDPDTGNLETSGGPSLLLSLLLAALFVGALFVVAQVLGAMLVRAGLDVTDGRRLTTAGIFTIPQVGPVLVAALMIGAAVFVGTLLCYLPGLVVGFVTQYTLYFMLDQDLAPLDAIRASVTLVKDNLGTTLLWYVVGGLVGGAGAILCGVGLLLTLPIALIGTAYTYRTLTGRPVAA